MDLKRLSYFLTVADMGSFSRAAVALDLAQPSLSRQIGLLEAELEQRLFIRTGRGVEMTEAGALLVEHARSLLAATRQMTDELRDFDRSPTGRLVIGMPPRVALVMGVGLVERFRVRFPRAVITIVEGLSLALREQLSSGRFDLALIFDTVAMPQMELRPLMRERLMLVGPPRTHLPASIHLGDLAAYPMVLPSAPNAIRGQVDAALRPGRHGLMVVAEVGAVQTTLALVAAGVGHTILPENALAISPEGKSLSRSPIVPEIWNSLMLALPHNLPTTRLASETVTLIEALARECYPV